MIILLHEIRQEGQNPPGRAGGTGHRGEPV